jgi:hypothetical protein
MMLINDNGGWCWYQDEKIYYDPCGGNVLTSTASTSWGFGGVSGARRSVVDTTTFNIATGKRTRIVAHNSGGGDDHNMGAFWIRPDGRYLHLYCPHYSIPGWSSGIPLTYYRLATYPNDGNAWGPETSFNWSTLSGISVSTGGDLSYTNIQYLSGEGTGSGRLYDIARWYVKTPNIAYSDDWGATWNYMGRLNKPAGGATYSNFYHKFAGNGVDRIDFIGVENHPRDNNNCVYHGYIKGGKAYDSNGTVIDSNLFNTDACSIQAFTRIFTAATPGPNTYHTGWTNELELDKNGYPVCLFQTRYGTTPWGSGSGQNTIGAADHRFWYGRFDGSAWHTYELCKMGTGLHSPEQDYIGMGCINPSDVNVIYVSTNYDPVTDVNVGKHEIFKGVTPDNGLTWDWTQITFHSTVDNIRPAIPRQWDANNTVVFWTRGSYPGQEQYNFTVVGMVEEENKTLGLVTYIDASTSNTTNADGNAFSPTGPSGSKGLKDDKWHEYTVYGNGGSCYTAGESGTENVPTIKTTVSGLADGTYDVFAYYWCVPTPDMNWSNASGGFDPNDWGIRAGFDPCDANMLCFFRQSSQFAEASQFSDPVTVTGTGVQLYRVYIGRKAVSGGSSVVVYLDNYDSTFTYNKPSRTTYDGVGVALVIPGDGDLNKDGKVNLKDIAVLGQGWLTIYGMDTLADIAYNWLYGT